MPTKAKKETEYLGAGRAAGISMAKKHGFCAGQARQAAPAR